MPKIIVDNAKGLYQTSGTGLALFNQAAEAITATTGGVTIDKASSSVIVTTAASGIVKLPSVSDLTVGAMIVINFGDTNTTNLQSEGASVEVNQIAGNTGLTIPANRSVLCVLQSLTNWAVIGMEA